MEIRAAIIEELNDLMAFCNDMCDVLNEKEFLPNGNKGGFPSRDMVVSAIHNQQQFIGVEDSGIVAAYILSHECDSAYLTVTWNVDAKENEFVVIAHRQRNKVQRIMPTEG